jgi:rhomboid protease GluP
MYGVYLAMLTTNHIEQRQRKAQLASIIFFVGYNLLMGIQGSIDNAAHTGGLVSGLLIGYAFMPGLKRPQNKAYSYASVAIAAIIILGAAYGVLNKLPKDMVQYENQMQTFAAIERKALSPFDLPGDTPKQQRLEAFRDSGIHYWREGKQVIASMANMDLPGAVVLRNKKLLHYCELRIRSYEAMTSYIAQGDSASGRKVDELSQQIKLVLDDLAGKTPVMQPPGE